MHASTPHLRSPAPATRPQPELRDLCPGEAVSAWLEARAHAGGPARLASVSMPIADAVGSVVAEPVWARRCSPPFPAAAMDGIAVTAADTAAAAPDRPVRLPANRFELVDTGNPLPSGRDSVVPRETILLDGDSAELRAPVACGHHVRAVGEDVAAGELLLAPGHRLGPIDAATAAAAGVTTLQVRRPARVAILPTGNELRPADAVLEPGELPDTNALMLSGMAREAGCETRVWPILPDDPYTLGAAVRTAAHRADLVLVIAGTSAGRHDHAPEVLRQCGRIVVHGVAMRPGHPAVLAVVDRAAVMACPGYPVSAALAFEELARPLIASLEGTTAPRRPCVRAHVAVETKSKPGARHLMRVRLANVDGDRVAMPLRGGASVLSSLAHADALLPIPSDQEFLEAVTPVEVELLRAGAQPDDTILLVGAGDLSVDLLALVVAGVEPRVARLGLCEQPVEEALGLVRDGLCHAAVIAGSARSLPRHDRALAAVRIATCQVGLVVATDDRRPAAPRDVLRRGVRIAVAPRGTPARLLLDDVMSELAPGARDSEIVEVRSDGAALATISGGYADCAVTTTPAAWRAGWTAVPLGRAAVDLAIHPGVAERDSRIPTVLEAVRSRSLRTALERAGYDPGVGAWVRADPQEATSWPAESVL